MATFMAGIDPGPKANAHIAIPEQWSKINLFRRNLTEI